MSNAVDDLLALEDPSAWQRPAEHGPKAPELLRYGWASAALHLHPELVPVWADTADRAVRRAVMRHPDLSPEAAELVVATRRTGMHTLGSNPSTPTDLLASNPGALGRRAEIDRIAPGGVDDVRENPNRTELIELASDTVDLVMATAPSLSSHCAVQLALRPDPIDPWVAALLTERFGIRVGLELSGHHSKERVAAVSALAPAAAHTMAGSAR